MRILLGALLRVRNAHLLQTADGLSLRLGMVQLLVELDGLDNLLADLRGRVHAGHRILEDHGDLVAADLLHFLVGSLHDVVASQIDLAALNARRRHRVELHDGLSGNGLAAAGLANDSQNLALVHVQRHAADGLNLACIGVKRHAQVFNCKNSLCHVEITSSASGRKRRADRRRTC